QLPEDRLDQVRDTGLPVGSRYGEHRRRLLTGAVNPGGNVPERRTRVRNNHSRKSRLCGEESAGLIGQDRHSAALGGLVGKARSVCPLSRQPYVQVTGQYLLRRQADTGDEHTLRSLVMLQPELFRELRE